MSGEADGLEQPRREWLRGVLDLCVLAVLEAGGRHGYGISQELERIGLGRVKGGTLYPLLARLEAEGAVAPEWDHPDSGPARKVYTLTDAGRLHLRESGERWLAFVARAAHLLEPAIGQSSSPRSPSFEHWERS